MNVPNQAVVTPCAKIAGSVRVEGDKSISHRAAMVAGLSQGASPVRGFLTGEDCLCTLRAVEALGADVRLERRRATARVTGVGGLFQAPGQVLDMGNSGTGIRLLAGLLAGHAFSSELTGDDSLRSRPMRRIQEPLERMGARVELTGPKGCAPVRIAGGHLRGIEYEMSVASAQVKSCILLAGLFAEGTTTVVEPTPTRDHTERMLRAAGISVAVEGNRLSVKGCGAGGPQIPAREWVVPGDFSSAAFWLAAAACREGHEVVAEDIGTNPRRTGFLEVLRRMGADIEIKALPGGPERTDPAWEPSGNVRVRGRRLRGTTVGGAEVANLIDELPLVCVLGALAEGDTAIRDAQELRVKESDRIAAMAASLTAFGVPVEEKPDGMIVHGGGRIRGNAEVDSRWDHRIAMASAILALFADGPVRILGTDSIATSYPGFWADMEKLTGRTPIGEDEETAC